MQAVHIKVTHQFVQVQIAQPQVLVALMMVLAKK